MKLTGLNFKYFIHLKKYCPINYVYAVITALCFYNFVHAVISFFQKEELSAEINTLSNEIQQMRKEDDDRIQTQSALSEAEAKIKHLESVSASHMEHLLQAQKQVQELEFENEKLQRKLSTQVIFHI